MIKQKKEFLFVLYIFLFILIRPIVLTVSNGTVVLMAAAAMMMLLSFYWKGLSELNLTMFVFMVGGMYLVFLVDILVRNNGAQTIEMYNYLIYGAIPLFLLKNVKDYRAVLKYYSMFSILTGLLYLTEPLNNYKLSGDYMHFGFSAMLPAFCGALLAFSYFKKKWFVVLTGLFLVELIIFANKSASLSAIAILCVAYIFFNDNVKHRWKKIGPIIVVLLLLWTFKESLLDMLIYFASKMGYSTYSLTTFRMLLTGKQELVVSSRISIWEEVVKLIKENWILGKGIGYLESVNIGYAHNVFLDLLVSFGFVGGSIFIVQFIRSFFRIKRFKDYDRTVFAILLLILWFIPMMFSLSLWRTMNFWIYWGVCFYGIGQRYRSLS